MITLPPGAPSALDTAACDREPIHLPGSIQPFGFLLALREPRLEVVQASHNLELWLKRPAEQCLGQSLDQLFGTPVAHHLRAQLAAAGPAAGPFDLQTITLHPHPHATRPGDPTPFHLLAFRSDGLLVLELEPVPSEPPLEGSPPLVSPVLINRLEVARSIAELSQFAADEVRRISGFDRVLVLQFDRQANGTVIAESRNHQLPSYLDLRFPSSDIPRQARELYRVNRIRLIADSDYTPVPIVPVLNPLTGRPLDLTFSSLRSVSPVHLEYMRNMRTAASMSISLLQQGELWGLITCHHHLPRQVPFQLRSACELLGRLFSLQLAALDQSASFERRLQLKNLQTAMLSSIASESGVIAGLRNAESQLLEFAAASGAAVVDDGACHRVGETPEAPQILQLCDWLSSQGAPEIYHTDALSLVHPPADPLHSIASGLLAISISKLHRSYVLWFRPEVIRTVNWGGEPGESKSPDKELRLHPRKSFDLWREVVRRRALPWLEVELSAAAEFRNALVGIVLRKAEELAQVSEELERSNRELESFSYSVSHDLRAPFRHIVGFSELLLATEGQHLSERGRRWASTITESARFAGTLVDNLLSFAHVGRATLNVTRVDMHRLVLETRDEFQLDDPDRAVEWQIDELPPATGDLVLLRTTWQNLLGNALKYSRGRQPARIHVGCSIAADEIIYFVADNGVGFDMQYVDKLFGVFQRLHRMEDYEGTGIGLANVRRIISRHHGRTWAEGQVENGATFFFSLPRPAEE